jgi:hypoxanthine phosphoribosyltransferase
LSGLDNDKIFVTEASQILDGYRLGEKIFASGYRPTFIVGLWRGGSTVALVVQECLAYLGVPADHTTIRTSYGGRPQYERSIERSEGISVHGKSYALESLTADDRLLIVDDVYRSGRHTNAVIEQLRVGLRRNMPKDVRVAALWKHADAEAENLDYYIHETDRWVVLPYELSGLSAEEIKEHKADLVDLFD